AFFNELGNLAVGSSEDLFVVYVQRNEAIDRKKPSVIDAMVRLLPITGLVVLERYQIAEKHGVIQWSGLGLDECLPLGIDGPYLPTERQSETFLVRADRDTAGADGVFERSIEKWQHQAARKIGWRRERRIKELVVYRMGTFFQYIPQPAVIRMNGHVVGYNILDPSDSGTAKFSRDPFQLLKRTDFRIKPGGVGLVVTMGTSGNGTENRRRVDGAYPQTGQVWD